MQVNRVESSLLQYMTDVSAAKKKEEDKKENGDQLSISNTSKAFAKIESFLNLGKPDRLDTQDLNPAEQKEFLSMLSKLLKAGVVGYEILEVNGKPEKHFIVTQIGNERLKGAKLYRQPVGS